MKDNTLIALVIAGAALWFFSRNRDPRIGTEFAMKNSGPLVSPLPMGGGGIFAPGGMFGGPASPTILALPQTNNNAEIAQYVNAGANLINAASNAFATYKGSTPAASSFITGPNGQTYAPGTGNAGTFYRAV